MNAPRFPCGSGRRFGATLALCLAVGLAGVPRLAAQTITVGVGDGSVTTVQPGGAFTLPIQVDMSQASGLDLASLTVTVTWDKSRVFYQASAAGGFGSVVINDSQKLQGSLTASLFNATGTTSSFDAITIDFLAGAAAGTTVIDVQTNAAGDESGVDLRGNVVDAPLVLCIAGTGGLWGDVNGDGSVNIIDAQQIARFSVGLPVADPTRMLTHGDVTADGNVNIIDAQQVARFSVGLSAAPRTGQPMAGCSVGTPSIGRTPGGLQFTAQQGSNPNPQTDVFIVTNSGGGTLNWTTSGVPGWYSLSSTSGALAAGQSETVTVTVNSASEPLGTFNAPLFISDPAAPNSPQAIDVVLNVVPPTHGAPVFCSVQAGVISAPGEVDRFSFAGSTGDIVSVALAQTAGFAFPTAAQGRLISPSGGSLGVFNANSQPEFTLPEDGTYVVDVSSSNMVTTGTYSVGHEGVLPHCADAVPMTLGDRFDGDISEAAEVDEFVFVATVGDIVSIALAQTGGFPFPTGVQATLFSPSGVELSLFGANQQPEFTIAETGTYVVQVHSSSYASTGTYSIGLEGVLPVSPDRVQMTLGDRFDGDLDAPAKVDEFVFDATVGDIVSIALAQTGGFAFPTGVQATLFSPSGAQSGFFGANQQPEFTIAETGTYVVQVHSSSYASTGTYSIGLEGVTPVSPDRIQMTLGDRFDGNLDASAKVDEYTFVATIGDIVSIALAQTGGFAFPTGVQATLFSPSGAGLSLWGANTQPEFTIAETGTYVVQVHSSSYASTGTYSIGLEGVLPVSPDRVQMTLGDRFDGNIDASAKVDEFVFDATVGDIVSIALAQTGGFAFPTGVQATLFSPSGAQSGFFGANQQPEFTIAETGTYVVQVHSSSYASTGTYSIGLEGVTPVSPDRIQMTLGDRFDGNIDASAKVDEFVFDATVGDIVSIALAQTGGFAFPTGVQATLFSPSGAGLSLWGANTQPEFTIAETGTYVVQVHSSSYASTGTYSIGLEGVLPVSPDRVQMTLGDRFDGNIDASAKVDEFVFDATVGDIVSIALAQTGGFAFPTGVQATLFSPSGAQSGFFGANQQPEFTIAETGTYVVQVHSSSYASTGTYSIGLEGVTPVSPDRMQMTLGDRFDGNIDASAKVDEFVFDATVGDIVSIALAQTGGFAFPTGVQATLFSPSGTRLTLWGANTQPEFTIAETGTYVVQVHSSSYASTGTYSIGLEGVLPVSGDAEAMASGTTLSRTIDFSAEVDAFTFTGVSGGSATITLTQTGGFAFPTASRATLFSPTGVLVAVVVPGAGNQFALTESGTYLIQVHSSDYRTTGSYDIGLTIP